tara:strand:+ start:592 stop:804 length:213 start_codon:yes stop_codon:yes gene_type:complete
MAVSGRKGCGRGYYGSGKYGKEDNPAWTLIDDSQNITWTSIDDSQTITWTKIANTQSPNFQKIDVPHVIE